MTFERRKSGGLRIEHNPGVDEMIQSIYTVISGPPGSQDWDRFRTMYHPRASIVRTRVDGDGKPVCFSFTPEEFVANGRELLKDISFYEVEIKRKTFEFGNLAQVFSAYDIFEDVEKTKFVKRGVNMIHLYNDGVRWWIMHIIWDEERKGVQIPDGLFA